MNEMNRNNKSGKAPENGPQRIEFPDGSYGVYMGETGKEQTNPRKRRQNNPQNRNYQSGAEQNGNFANAPLQGVRQSGQTGAAPAGQRNFPQNAPSNNNARPINGNNHTGAHPRYALTEAQRREIERRHAAARAKRRAAADGRLSKYQKTQTAEPTLKEGVVKYVTYYFKQIVDRIYMTWMGITIDLDTIIKSLIIAGMILLFAILQTTVFSRFALFGATPDLMLALVIAIGSTEGERWGGATGLAAAFIIEALGGTGITLLPLLYVPVGYTIGVLSTGYLRDTALIRVIYTFSAGLLRAVITAIYAGIYFDKIDTGLLFTAILIPEYFSTAFMAILPHVTEWFALKAFHKSREDRVS